MKWLLSKNLAEQSPSNWPTPTVDLHRMPSYHVLELTCWSEPGERTDFAYAALALAWLFLQVALSSFVDSQSSLIHNIVSPRNPALLGSTTSSSVSVMVFSILDPQSSMIEPASANELRSCPVLWKYNLILFYFILKEVCWGNASEGFLLNREVVFTEGNKLYNTRYWTCNHASRFGYLSAIIWSSWIYNFILEITSLVTLLTWHVISYNEVLLPCYPILNNV